MDGRTAFRVGSLLLLVLLAGCSAAGSIEMQPATDDAMLADRASRSPATPDEGPVRDRRIVQRAIENGTTTAESRNPLVGPGLPFASDGTYYNVSWAAIDRQEGVAVEIAIDYNGTAPANETVAYETLSAGDRERLDDLLPQRTDRLTEGYDFGVGVTYNETERGRSVLLSGEYDAVRYEGETYPVEVDDFEPVTVTTYRYTATVVANSSAEYATQLREQYLFTLSGLSEDERSVVDAAINDTYYADDSDDEAFRSVLERFVQHEAMEANEYRGTWLVRYDGTVYIADLSYEEFDVR